MYTLPKTVVDAAKILDVEKPGWASKIDLNIFDITDADKCPLGQLYGRFKEILIQFFGEQNWSKSAVFSCHEYQTEWINEITTRLLPKQVEGSFAWAVEQMTTNKKVRRKGWQNKNYYINCNSGHYYTYDGVTRNFMTADFTSSDWELFTKVQFAHAQLGKQFRHNDIVYTKVQESERDYGLNGHTLKRFSVTEAVEPVE